MKQTLLHSSVKEPALLTHLDLGLLSSKTVRQQISVVLLQQPSKQIYLPILPPDNLPRGPLPCVLICHHACSVIHHLLSDHCNRLTAALPTTNLSHHQTCTAPWWPFLAPALTKESHDWNNNKSNNRKNKGQVW
jgi:hypothetical protein